ncbi:MAG: tetratricopeptide repeat protein [Saprospirales bacterium]|nr:tetratricopeptide repeat protein [Saprospirales bacterium]
MAVELYTRIEDYLDGVMNAQARQAFEAELHADPALAEALATVQEARERLRRQWMDEQADTALLSTLYQLGKSHFTGSSPADKKSGGGARIFRLPQAWWAAAAAMAILVVAWFFWRPPAQERLYVQYRAFPEADFAVRGGGSAEQPLQLAAEAFNREDYAAALPALRNYLQRWPDDTEARMFAGFCYMELKQFDAATTIFEQIGGSANAWSDEANWSLALAYLRQNKRSECIVALETIAPANGRYGDAQDLLKRLQ